MSRETLARRAGLHRNTIRMLESGRTDATVIAMARALASLGVTGAVLRDQGVTLSGSLPSTGDSGPTGALLDLPSRTKVLQTCGHVVATRRAELGLSQEALAERSGLHPNTIGEIERGTEDPELTTPLGPCSAPGITRVSVRTEGVTVD